MRHTDLGPRLLFLPLGGSNDASSKFQFLYPLSPPRCPAAVARDSTQ